MSERACKLDPESGARVIPFPRRPENDQLLAEAVDLAALNDSEVISYTIAKLYHPSTQSENAAHRLIMILNGDEDNDSALRERLQQILAGPALTDELYDDLEQNDELFQQMSRFMRETKTKDPSELRVECRKAVLVLMELYAFSLTDESGDPLAEEAAAVFNKLAGGLDDEV